MIERPRLMSKMNTVWHRLNPSSNAERVSIDYQLDVRFRNMLGKYKILLSSRDPFDVIRAIVGPGCVERQEGHIVLPSAHAKVGMAAIDLVDEVITSLGLGEKMPRSEEAMLQLINAVFHALPADCRSSLSIPTLAQIKQLVVSAAAR